MTTYQMVQITNAANVSTLSPWVIGGLIALVAALIVGVVVVMIVNRLS